MNMNFISESCTRKLDSLGRLVIPKSLRERVGFKEGEEMYFYTCEDNGKKYICVTNREDENRDFAVAAKVLAELGLEVPEELKKKLG